METWQINISLIPSIAVILSSSNRLVLGLTDEINNWYYQKKESKTTILTMKIKQLKRLSIAIFLYVYEFEYFSYKCLIGRAKCYSFFNR